MKIWLNSDKRKVMTFWILVIFNETWFFFFYEQSIWICKWLSWWCLKIFHYFVHSNDENPIFQLWESKNCLISTLIKCKIMFALIYFDMGTSHAFRCLSNPPSKKKKKKNLYNFIYKMYGQKWREAMTSSTHSFAYSYHSTVQEMFPWKLRNFITWYLPYFLSDLKLIFTILFDFFPPAPSLFLLN